METFTLHDQHVHTHYSMDSNQAIEPYVQLAIQRGCKYFVTTDHMDLDSLFFEIKDWDIDFDGYNHEMKQLQEKYPQIQILRGIEVGYMKKNHLKTLKKFIDQDLDVINLSIHQNDEIDYYHIQYFMKKGIHESLNIYFDNILEGLNTFKCFNVLSHIDYGFKTAYLNNNHLKIQDYEEKLIAIFKLLIQKGKALEINTKVQSALPIEHTKYLLNVYYKVGGRKLTLSSDAHQLEFYQHQYDKYINLIKEAGFTYLCYFIKQKEYHYTL